MARKRERAPAGAAQPERSPGGAISTEDEAAEAASPTMITYKKYAG